VFFILVEGILYTGYGCSLYWLWVFFILVKGILYTGYG